MVFDHVEGAEKAYADVLGASASAPWVHEIAFVEHHRHDRIVVRGTVAGRYVDVDEQGDVIGKRTAEGALTGAVVGVFFGPPGLAIGLVAGGTAGGLSRGRARPPSSRRLPRRRPCGGSREIVRGAPARKSRARRRDGGSLRGPWWPSGASSPSVGGGAGTPGRPRWEPRGPSAARRIIAWPCWPTRGGEDRRPPRPPQRRKQRRVGRRCSWPLRPATIATAAGCGRATGTASASRVVSVAPKPTLPRPTPVLEACGGCGRSVHVLSGRGDVARSPRVDFVA